MHTFRWCIQLNIDGARVFCAHFFGTAKFWSEVEMIIVT